MRLQVFSDIHLEFGPMETPASDADVVIAAGDIDQQTQSIDWLKRLDKPVILVAGNHDVWGGDLYGSIEALRAACEGSNIHFLEQNQVTIDGVTFFGCTLWTDFNDADPLILDHARECMNDFVYIGHKGYALEPEELVRLNRESVAWLKKAVGRPTENRPVVVTHHAPSLRSWGFDPGDAMRFAYCNQLDDWLKEADIPLWVHGHVHSPSDYRVGGTRVVCNPRGYWAHGLVDRFKPDKVIEV